MRALAGELLLLAWDRGGAEHNLERALTMLSLALPDADYSLLLHMPMAERNLQLLRLQETSFGPRLNAFSECAQCGARLEFSLPVAALRAGLQEQMPAGPAEWIENGRHYRLRPVTSIDLLASLSMEDPADAAAYVLTSCLEPAEGLLAATEHFDVLNQGAELRFQVVCPSCRSSETLDLDIAGFVWAEVRLGAQRLLGEIHELASAYGWSEESIAVMSEQRRAAYLEMLSA